MPDVFPKDVIGLQSACYVVSVLLCSLFSVLFYCHTISLDIMSVDVFVELLCQVSHGDSANSGLLATDYTRYRLSSLVREACHVSSPLSKLSSAELLFLSQLKVAAKQTGSVPLSTADLHSRCMCVCRSKKYPQAGGGSPRWVSHLQKGWIINETNRTCLTATG